MKNENYLCQPHVLSLYPKLCERCRFFPLTTMTQRALELFFNYHPALENEKGARLTCPTAGIIMKRQFGKVLFFL